MTKLKETAISPRFGAPQHPVVDPAMIPSTPARPARTATLHWRFLVAWLAASVWLSGEYLDNTVRPRTTSKRFRLPRSRCTSVCRFERGQQAPSASASFSSNGHDSASSWFSALAQVADVGSVSRHANFHSPLAG